VLYTDGVTDAENSARQRFGRDRLLDVVTSAASGSAAAMAAAIESAIAEFSTDAQYDDITLVVARRAPRS
jgi:serine phosphatase RsbU (regulator of sigma subunit)